MSDMTVERQTGRRFCIDGETITTRRVADGDRLLQVLGGSARPRRQRKYSAEIEELAQYMTRGFHDWMAAGRYYIAPGFRRLVGQPREVTVHYLGLRDDWEDECRRALDAWEATGFDFQETDIEAADILFDDEMSGAYYRPRRFCFAGRHHEGMPVVHGAGREINISKLWPEWQVLDALIHEIGHALGLGHPGAYNGSRPPQANPHDTSANTIMSYYGGPTGRLGDADRLAIELIYG